MMQSGFAVCRLQGNQDDRQDGDYPTKHPGHAVMHDLTRPVQDALRRCGLQAGIVTVFCSSSTSALTTHVPPATCALSPSHPVTFPQP